MVWITPTTTNHGSSDMATADLLAVNGQTCHISQRREVYDPTALTIASWYASPRAKALTSLAQGKPVLLDHLLDDIRDARFQCTEHLDQVALDCLATWALNHPSRRGETP